MHRIKEDKKANAINQDRSFIRLGDGSDIRIDDKCNINGNSYSNFGSAYQLPNGMTSGTD